jgi:hypothetical protein
MTTGHLGGHVLVGFVTYYYVIDTDGRKNDLN